MAKFVQDEVTLRFLRVHKILKIAHEKEKKKLLDTTFSRNIGTFPNILSDIVNGRRNVSPKYLECLYDSYPNVRREYIRTGKLPELSGIVPVIPNDSMGRGSNGDVTIEALQEKIHLLQQLIADKERIIAEKQKIISLYEARSLKTV